MRCPATTRRVPIRPLRRRLSSRCTTMNAVPARHRRTRRGLDRVEVGSRRPPRAPRPARRTRHPSPPTANPPRAPPNRTRGPPRTAELNVLDSAAERCTATTPSPPLSASALPVGSASSAGAAPAVVAWPRRGRRRAPRRHRRAGRCRRPGCAAAPAEFPTAATHPGQAAADESVTTMTAMAQPPRLPVVTPGLGEPLQHQFGDRLVRLEVPVDAVGIAATAHHLVGDSGFQIHERNVVLPRPFGDRGDGASRQRCDLAVGVGDVHRRASTPRTECRDG